MNFRNRIDRLERMFGGDDSQKMRHAKFAQILAKANRATSGTTGERLTEHEESFLYNYLKSNTNAGPESAEMD